MNPATWWTCPDSSRRNRSPDPTSGVCPAGQRKFWIMESLEKMLSVSCQKSLILLWSDNKMHLQAITLLVLAQRHLKVRCTLPRFHFHGSDSICILRHTYNLEGFVCVSTYPWLCWRVFDMVVVLLSSWRGSGVGAVGVVGRAADDGRLDHDPLVPAVDHGVWPLTKFFFVSFL